MGLSFQLII